MTRRQPAQRFIVSIEAPRLKMDERDHSCVGHVELVIGYSDGEFEVIDFDVEGKLYETWLSQLAHMRRSLPIPVPVEKFA